jgi:hypothetical protein
VGSGANYLVVEVGDFGEEFRLIPIATPEDAKARDAKFDVVHSGKGIGEV